MVTTSKPVHRGNVCSHNQQDNTTWENCTEQKYFMCCRKESRDSFLIEQNMTWYEAQRYCRENYTDLVSIRNEAQKEEVKNKGMNSTTPYWIGLLYDDWEWSAGGRSAYRNWMYNPNAGDIHTVLYQSGQGILTVGNGGTEDYTLCSEGSVRIYIISEMMSWEQALDYCNNYHHGLLRIETAEDLELIKQKFNGTDFTWSCVDRAVSLGSGCGPMGCQWDGVTGRETDSRKQPLSNHCGAKATEEGYKWSDQDCLSKRFFICNC
ncbi:unnamed protein product [Coregonus sp. 'balchen']|nr:unnamed protein product [Coregonus sp. 'balchen']